MLKIHTNSSKIEVVNSGRYMYMILKREFHVIKHEPDPSPNHYNGPVCEKAGSSCMKIRLDGMVFYSKTKKLLKTK